MRWKTAFGLLLAGTATNAWAQTPPAEPTDTDIVVTGQRAALNEAREVERQADGIKNVITADDAGQFADQNVAEALQRLPGVSIERSEGEGRFVSIRGLDPAFNTVTINGVRLGSTEKEDAAVALDTVPADLLSQVEVSKTATPDMDGDAIGGAIEIKTLSAFDGKDKIQLRAEGSYNQIAEEISPKFSASITRKFADDRLGVALAVSYFDRKVQSDQLRNDEGLRCARVGATTNGLATAAPGATGCDEANGYFLRPEELDVRIKVGTRERIGATLNLEFKPADEALIFLRATHTRLTDSDNRFQEETEFRRVTDRRDILAIGPRTGRLDGIRYETQIFQQEIEDRVWSLSLGGENKFGNLTLSTQGDWSRTQRASPGIRARFQARNGSSTYSLDENSIDITSGVGIRRPTNTSFTPTVGSDPTVATNLLFEQLFIDAEEGEDEIYTGRFDARYDFDGGALSYFKAGFKYRDRTKQTDVDEFDFAARSAPFNRTETLGGFALSVPKNTQLPLYNAFPNLRELTPFLDTVAAQAAGLPGVLVNSNREDFVSSEQVLAGYVMGVLEPSAGLRIIGGARVEKTEFQSDGNFVFDSDGSALPDTTVANPSVTNKFTDILPTVLVRYEASSDLLVRGSFNLALQRPNFEDTRNVHSALDDGTTRSVDLQNPLLNPAKAMQFDASVAWYPNRNTGVTLGVFYKRIRDFIVDADFLNVDIRAIPGVNVPLPAALPGGFIYNNVEVPVNGDVGKIWGVEFAYSQNFTFLPQPLNGLFAQVSATWADSKATSSVRAGSFAFPDQPKWVVNGSLGYEDKGFSVRGSMTYRDAVLDSIASTPVLDELRPSFTSFDVNVRLNITDTIQLYADGINLSNEQDESYYRGDANGGFFSQIERYGRTFQVGVRASF